MTGVLGAVVLLVLAWFLVPFGLRKWEEARLRARCRAMKAIVLTYDDGPGTVLTEQLLDLLSRRGVRASFFVLGRNAAARPEVVRRLVAGEHEVGTHTQEHSNAWKTDPLTAARDLARGISTVSALGADARLFRPPFGKLTLAGLVDGTRRGLRYGWWTVDSRDSWARRPIDDVLSEIEARGGGVVLMHDYDSYGGDAAPGAPSHAEHVLALTERIIDFARAGGYRLIRLGDLAESSATRRQAA